MLLVGVLLYNQIPTNSSYKSTRDVGGKHQAGRRRQVESTDLLTNIVKARAEIFRLSVGIGEKYNLELILKYNLILIG